MTTPSPKAAMILAAGLGKRMRPLTEAAPKALVPVDGTPLIDWAIHRFRDAGVETLVVNTHHHAEQMVRHLDRVDGMAVTVAHETDVLETGGGIKNALPALGGKPFYVANCDSIWLNGPMSALERMADAWSDEVMDVLLLVTSTVEAVGYDGLGDFFCDPDGRLTRRPEAEVAPYVFTGVQIVHPRAFVDTPGGKFSMNRVFDSALEAGRLYGVVHDGVWLHVGTPHHRDEAEALLGERYADLRRR